MILICANILESLLYTMLNDVGQYTVDAIIAVDDKYCYVSEQLEHSFSESVYSSESY